MKRLQVSVLALSTIALLLPPAIAAADPPSPKALVLPIAGAGAGGIRFTGTVAVQRFVQLNGEVFAMGAVSGTASGPSGAIGTSLFLPVSFRVHVGDRLTASSGRRSIPAVVFSAP